MMERCYVFAAGGVRFAVPLAALRRVHRVEEVTRVPCAPEAVAGVALLLDEVVGCLDPGRLAGRPALPPGPCVAALVETPDLRFALLAAEVGSTEEMDPARLGPLPADLAERLRTVARGLAELAGGAAVALDLAALASAVAPRWTAAEAHVPV